MAVAEEKSGFNAPAVVLLALAVLIFVYALSLFMQGGFMKAQELERQYKTSVAPENEAARAAEADQQSRLDEGYRWIDEDQGKVGMSIDDAKTLLVQKGMTGS